MNAPQKMTAIESGEHEGIDWCVVEAPLWGAVNGYVRIPDGHPWHGKDYDDVPVDAHGGLTYGSDKLGWVGFDTLHAGDYWPGVPYSHEGDRSWTVEAVIEETKALASRVAHMVEGAWA